MVSRARPSPDTTWPPAHPGRPGPSGRLPTRRGCATTPRRRSDRTAAGRAGCSASTSGPERRRPSASQASELAGASGRTATPYRAISAARPVCSADQNHVPPYSTSTPVPGSSRYQVRPPSRSRASSTTTERPASRRSRAAIRPANPPPTTTTSGSVTRRPSGPTWSPARGTPSPTASPAGRDRAGGSGAGRAARPATRARGTGRTTRPGRSACRSRTRGARPPCGRCRTDRGR